MDIRKVHIITAAELSQTGIILFVVGKDEVANSDFYRFDQSAANLLEAKRKAAGSILISFDYDDDLRELYDIPEVVAYMKALFERCPHFLYFIVPEFEALYTLVFCVMDALLLYTGGGNARIAFDDVTRSAGILKKLIDDASSYSWDIGDKKTPILLRNALSRIGTL